MTSLADTIDFGMTERKAQESGLSVFDIPQNLAYSVAGVATSVATSFYNTGAMVANLVREDDFELADTGDWVQKWAGGQAAEFYDQHSDIIEVGGLIAGSFVPGGLAVKGLRGVQASRLKGMTELATGKAPNIYTRAKTGLRKAVAPPAAMDNIANDIRAGKVNALYSPGERMKLFRDGTRQQLLESFVYEAATVGTMVANPTLSGEELDYIDALSQNFGSVLFGTALGGAAGGLFKYAADKGKLDKLTIQINKEFNPHVINTYKSTQASLLGDRVVDELNVLRDKSQEVRKLDVEYKKLKAEASDRVATDRAYELLRVTKRAEDQAKNRLLGTLTQNIENEFARNQFYDMLKKMPTDKVADFAGGATRIDTMSPRGNLRSPILDMVARVDEPPVAGIEVEMDLKKGFLKIGREDLFKMDNDEVLQMWDAAVSGKKAHDAIEALGKTQLKEPLDKELASFFAEENKTIKDRIAALTAKLQKKNLSDPDFAEMADALALEESMLRAIERPEIGMQKLFKIFDNADGPTLRKLKKQFPTADKMFMQTRNGRSLFGPTEAYVDITDGKVLTDEAVVPRASDLGEIKVRANSIQVDGTQYTYDLNTTKPVQQMSLVEATAKYAIAETDPDKLLRGYIGSAGRAIDTYDFPRIYAGIRKLADADGKKKGVKYKNSAGTTLVYKDVRALMREVKKAKRRAIPEIAARKNFSMQHIAEMTDSDISWVNGHYLTTTGPDDFSKAFRNYSNAGESATLSTSYSQPKYLKVDYDKSFETEAEIHGMLEAERRMGQEIQKSKELGLNYFGDDSRQLPAELSVDAVTSADRAAGFVTANHSRYEIGGFKGIGAFLNNRFNKMKVEVERAFSNTAQHLVKNENAVIELNSVRNMARQGKYYFYRDGQDFISKEIAAKANQFPNLTKLMFSNPEIGNMISRQISGKLKLGRASLLHQEALDPVRNTLNTLELSSDMANLKPADIALMIDNMEVPDLGKAAGRGAVRKYEFDNDETAKFVDQYVTENNKSIQHRRNLAERTGNNITFEENMFYPGAIDTEKYNAVAYVQFNDAEKIYGSKNVGVITAATQEDLERKIAIAEKEFSGKAKIVRRGEQKEALEAQLKYDAELDMTENVVDSSLYNRGVLWEVMPEVSPNVVEEMVGGHIRSLRNLDRGFVSLLYEREIAELSQMEKAYSPQAFIDTAKQKAAAGAWQRQINTMLDIPTNADHTWYLGAQQQMAKGLTKAYGAIAGVFRSASNTNNAEEWKKLDEYLEKTGMPRPYSNAENYLKLNTNIPDDQLEGFIAKANGVASTLMLRLDAAQGIVNAISMPIMLQPAMRELKQFLKEDELKRITGLTEVAGPGGLKEPTNFKLAMDAMGEFFLSPNRKELIAELRAQGIVGNSMHEIVSATEAITLKPGTDAGTFRKGLDKAVGIMSKVSDTSEEFVKFTAARMAQKILENSSIPKESQWAVVRSFVDRVHGNYVSSQRPTAFRGFAGQAIGLFQTYQFNLYQQLFNGIARGDKAAIAQMVGLQGSIFGAQSIPGFQLVNDHIANRHSDYRNLYTSAKQNFGDDLSEWMIYGAGSNIFKPIPGLGGIDLYSRGDLTPRTPILVPTSPMEIPIVNILSKSIGNMARTFEKVGTAIGTGNPEAIPTIAMEALAHNGFNRPLAGVSQMALGYRTTNQGSLINTYNETDNIGWAWATKMIGAKPLDEGIAVNQYYRAMGYRTARLQKTAELGRTFKDVVRSNNGMVSGESYQNFMREYVANGGSYDGFRQWTQNQMAGATESIVNTMAEGNKSPEGKYLQAVMGAEMENLSGF